MTHWTQPNSCLTENGMSKPLTDSNEEILEISQKLLLHTVIRNLIYLLILNTAQELTQENRKAVTSKQVL